MRHDTRLRWKCGRHIGLHWKQFATRERRLPQAASCGTTCLKNIVVVAGVVCESLHPQLEVPELDLRPHSTGWRVGCRTGSQAQDPSRGVCKSGTSRCPHNPRASKISHLHVIAAADQHQAIRAKMHGVHAACEQVWAIGAFSAERQSVRPSARPLAVSCLGFGGAAALPIAPSCPSSVRSSFKRFTKPQFQPGTLAKAWWARPTPNCASRRRLSMV